MYKFGIVFGALLIVSACQSKTQDKDPLLEEAYQLHLEAIQIQSEIKPRIDSLHALDSVRYDSLKTAFQYWEENLVEVPGFEHDHDHDHGHEHDHHQDHGSAQPQVTAQQMKDIQNESLQNIKKIKALVAQP